MDLLEKAKAQRKEVLKEPPKEAKKNDMFADLVPVTKKKSEAKKTAKTTVKNEKMNDHSKKKAIETTFDNAPPKQELAVFDAHATQPIVTKDDIDRHVEMYNYVKQSVVEDSDFAVVKGKKFLKKSGVRKFINAFGISIELVEEKVYELKINGVLDTHAEVRVRATTKNGQSMEGMGIKSWSELYEKSLHNLKATAWTRAVNRAILDLVGFGEVSAEEID